MELGTEDLILLLLLAAVVVAFTLRPSGEAAAVTTNLTLRLSALGETGASGVGDVSGIGNVSGVGADDEPGAERVTVSVGRGGVLTLRREGLSALPAETTLHLAAVRVRDRLTIHEHTLAAVPPGVVGGCIKCGEVALTLSEPLPHTLYVKYLSEPTTTSGSATVRLREGISVTIALKN